MPEPESEGGYCRSAVRYILEGQWGVAMYAAGLGPTFFEEVHLSLPRTYPIKVRKYKKSDAGQPLFHVWRVLDRRKLSSFQIKPYSHLSGHTIARSHPTS
jgi:hypothetical protein